MPALALVLNAFVWGVSWWPFRQLEGMGLHPLWTTVVIFSLAVAMISIVRPRAWGQLLRVPQLWWLVLAAGATNATFNWAVTICDVVRVVLLFYLMPVWTALLAWGVLGEPLARSALLRIALAMGGAAVVLWPEHGGFPLPQSLADWLGVIGGFTFALNNVMLRRLQRQAEEGRALAMFLGGVLVAGVCALVLNWRGDIAPLPAPQAGWLVAALGLGLLFVGSNLALQYGASRLPANTTAVVMLTEIVFASGSALALGGGTLTPTMAGGGLMILAAALLAARGSGDAGA